MATGHMSGICLAATWLPVWVVFWAGGGGGGRHVRSPVRAVFGGWGDLSGLHVGP